MSHLSTLIERIIRFSQSNPPSINTDYHMILSKIWNLAEYISEWNDYSEEELVSASKILVFYDLPKEHGKIISIYQLLWHFFNRTLPKNVKPPSIILPKYNFVQRYAEFTCKIDEFSQKGLG